MTRIYLIRHGEAEGNIFRRAQGQYDGLITAKGLRQIDALAERFRNEGIDALYASDLKRTLRTAEAITRFHDLPLRREPRLRELALGAWEDQPFGDLEHRFPEEMRRFNDDPAAWRAEGAETFSHLQRRIHDTVLELGRRHPGQTVVCVSHGTAIRSLVAALQGVPSAEIWRVPHGDNTAVTLLELEDGALRVAYCNDASHLSPALSTFARQSWWQHKGAVDRNNVHFQRLDPAVYSGTYLEFYKKTWLAVHGDLSGYQPALYLDAAVRHVRADPDALVTIVRPDGETVGITELDTLRGAEQGLGWICLCYIEPAYRRTQLGVQLLGHAVSVFRRLGRRAVRLSVYEGNAGAIAFYEEYGFRAVGETQGVASRLLIMERELN